MSSNETYDHSHNNFDENQLDYESDKISNGSIEDDASYSSNSSEYSLDFNVNNAVHHWDEIPLTEGMEHKTMSIMFILIYFLRH